MKSILIFVLSFTILPICYAGEGSGGGGPRPSNNIQYLLNKIQNGPGVGGGGTPFSPREIQSINHIDNIEVSNEIRFPITFNDKIKLLKNLNLQSIQLVDGQIVEF